jgi:hypothetical protein
LIVNVWREHKFEEEIKVTLVWYMYTFCANEAIDTVHTLFSQMLISEVRWMRRLELPTEIVNAPLGTTHFCLTTSHTDRSFLRSAMSTDTDAPAPMNVRSKPRRTFGGSPEPSGKVTYTCETS